MTSACCGEIRSLKPETRQTMCCFERATNLDTKPCLIASHYNMCFSAMKKAAGFQSRRSANFGSLPTQPAKLLQLELFRFARAASSSVAVSNAPRAMARRSLNKMLIRTGPFVLDCGRDEAVYTPIFRIQHSCWDQRSRNI